MPYLMSPGAFDRKICNSSVEPTPSRMSTPKRALPGVADRFRQRLAGGGADPQPRSAALVLQGVVVQHRGEQRRHAEEDAGIVSVHQREHRSRRRAFGMQHRGGADRHREGQRVAEAVGEKQFRRRQPDIVLANPEHLARIGVRGRGEVGMQVPHALGHAGRARGIQPECRLVGMGRHRREAIAFAGEFIRQFLVAVGVAAGNHDVIEVLHPSDHVPDHRQQRFGDEQHPGAAIRQHIGVLIRGQKRIERHRHHAGADRAEKHRRKIHGVEHDHRNALFAANAEPAQHVGDAAALLLQFAVAQLGNRVGEGELCAAALVDIAVEQPGHRVIGAGRLAHAALPLAKRVTTLPPRLYKNYNS